MAYERTIRKCPGCDGHGLILVAHDDVIECDKCGTLGTQVLMAGKWINPIDWIDVMADAIPQMLQVWPSRGYHPSAFDAGHRAMHAVDVPGEQATPDELRLAASTQ